MASLYQRRGKWHIDYWVNGKRITKNLKLAATTRNRKIAEKIKTEIEKEVENLSVDYNNAQINNSTVNDLVTMGETIKLYKSRMTLRSKSHQVLFDIVITRLTKFVSVESLVTEVVPEHIIGFIKSYRDEVSNSTLITYLNYLKGFFNFLIDEELISKSPVRKKDLPKRERNRIITFNGDMRDEILTDAKNRDRQFYNILMLMKLTGIRPNDVLRLKAGDFDFENEIINVKIAKTKKEIKFPMYNLLKQFLETEMPEIMLCSTLIFVIYKRKILKWLKISISHADYFSLSKISLYSLNQKLRFYLLFAICKGCYISGWTVKTAYSGHMDIIF